MLAGDQRPADAAPEAVIVILHSRSRTRLSGRINLAIVVPRVGVKQLASEVFICRAVERVRAALGHQHHLSAGGREEVGGLIVGGYFKFFNALDRGGDPAHARVLVAIVALEVAGKIATIQHVGILVA